jgi:hypothetical protein
VPESRQVKREEMRVRSHALADRVRELIHEGSVRRIIVKNVDGHTILEIPVTAGVIAAVLAPIAVALGAIAALAAEWSIEVERIAPATAEEAPAISGTAPDATVVAEPPAAGPSPAEPGAPPA